MFDYCDNPCATMGISFGYPEHHAQYNPSDKSFAKFYFKSQINVRRSVLSYTGSSMLAEIGAYLGFLLGFSLLDVTAIIRHFCDSKFLFTQKSTYCNFCTLKKRQNSSLSSHFHNTEATNTSESNDSIK